MDIAKLLRPYRTSLKQIRNSPQNDKHRRSLAARLRQSESYDLRRWAEILWLSCRSQRAIEYEFYNELDPREFELHVLQDLGADFEYALARHLRGDGNQTTLDRGFPERATSSLYFGSWPVTRFCNVAWPYVATDWGLAPDRVNIRHALELHATAEDLFLWSQKDVNPVALRQLKITARRYPPEIAVLNQYIECLSRLPTLPRLRKIVLDGYFGQAHSLIPWASYPKLQAVAMEFERSGRYPAELRQFLAGLRSIGVGRTVALELSGPRGERYPITPLALRLTRNFPCHSLILARLRPTSAIPSRVRVLSLQNPESETVKHLADFLVAHPDGEPLTLRLDGIDHMQESDAELLCRAGIRKVTRLILQETSYVFKNADEKLAIIRALLAEGLPRAKALHLSTRVPGGDWLSKLLASCRRTLREFVTSISPIEAIPAVTQHMRLRQSTLVFDMACFDEVAVPDELLQPLIEGRPRILIFRLRYGRQREVNKVFTAEQLVRLQAASPLYGLSGGLL